VESPATEPTYEPSKLGHDGCSQAQGDRAQVRDVRLPARVRVGQARRHAARQIADLDFLEMPDPCGYRPRRGLRTVRRDERIVKDICRFPAALDAIIAAKGAKVEHDLDNRQGWRKSKPYQPPRIEAAEELLHEGPIRAPRAS
jgi:hypothetical protein